MALFSSQQSLFEPRTIRAVISLFFDILKQGLGQPSTPIISLPLSNSPSSHNKIGSLHASRTNYPRDLSIIDVFREQVTAFPDKVAIKDALGQLTYAELDQRSDELSLWLSKRHFVPETLVGVFAPRSCETVIAFFGILKAGLAYLPLEVGAPAARIETILRSVSGHKLILSGKDARPSSPDLKDVEFQQIADDTLRRVAQPPCRRTAAAEWYSSSQAIR